MTPFDGKVMFLDRDDINTDEIIPAKYLTENTKEALRPYLLEDLHLEGFNASRDLPGKQVIVTRSNFGCGSSREHAPWALEVNGIRTVIGVSFARIFRQNMFNCGLLALELPPAVIDSLFSRFAGKPTEAHMDLDQGSGRLFSGDDAETFSIALSAFDRALVAAGGWVAYADARY
ncbi:MAG: 3-isopropylmalate dehydratase small subunit [Desulfobacterales bacterium]|nr:3-isopropylmalate dehydratase small subunit [Desulfobacterales bacterium]